MKLVLICALVLHGLLAPFQLQAAEKNDKLSYEGKISAQIIRHVSVPFPVIVDKVMAAIGDNVRKGENLLSYHLEARDARGMQNELLTAGGQAEWQTQRSNLERQLLHAGSKRSLSSQLSSKGLASSEEKSKDARDYELLRKQLQALKQKENNAKSDFSIRLAELETYLGHKLKAGQKLPEELFMTSPIDATVISMSPQARPMGLLNGTAFTLAIMNPIQVQIQVHESEITQLHVGQHVTVEMPGDKKLQFPGKISMLSWQPTDAAIAVPSFYYVWVDVENPDHILKPGYKVIVHVQPGAD